MSTNEIDLPFGSKEDVSMRFARIFTMSTPEKDPLVLLEELTETQCTDGNWNYSPYMLGMANGMILALAVMKGVDPEYLEAPEVWGADKPGESLVMDKSLYEKLGTYTPCPHCGLAKAVPDLACARCGKV